MGKKHSVARLLLLTFSLLLMVFNVAAIGFSSYARSIERAAIRREVLGFSIHEVHANHFQANPYSSKVMLSSAYSNEGYIVIKNETDDRLLANLEHEDGETLVYTVEPGITYCSLTEGDGSYKVLCGKQNENALLIDNVKTTVSDDEIYTYPNSYVMFAPGSKVMELCSIFPSNKEDYMNAVCKYLSKYGYYTTEGDRLETWYVPSPDKFVDTFRGDCFDFASFVAAAFRMRGIPCKLVVGDCAGEGHAWIEVKAPYTGNLGGYPMKEGEWCMVDPTVFVSSNVDYDTSAVLLGEYYHQHQDDYKKNYSY